MYSTLCPLLWRQTGVTWKRCSSLSHFKLVLTVLEKKLRGNCWLCNINLFPYTLFVDTQVQHIASFALKTNRSELKRWFYCGLKIRGSYRALFGLYVCSYFSHFKLLFNSSWKETEGQLFIMQHKSIHLHPFCWYTSTAPCFLCF